MRTAALAITVALATQSAGCVTGAGIWKRNSSVSMPLLLGAVAADFVVISAVAYQVRDFTVAGSLGTGLAVTAVDFGIGCLIGSCSSLRL